MAAAYTRRVAVNDVFLIIGWLLEILTLVILVRVIISWIPHVNPDNPFIRTIRAIADPILAPFRGLLPSLGGGMLDLSPVLAFVVLEVLAQVFFSLAQNATFGYSPSYIALSAVEQIVVTVLVIVIVILILRFLVVLFHADPWHALTRGIRTLAAPFCRPFETLTTSGSSIDVASLVACVVYVVVLVVVQVVFNNIILPTVAT